MKLTRREKHFIFAAALILPPLNFAISKIWGRVGEGAEILQILLIAIPLGFYLATDPEHRKAGK